MKNRLFVVFAASVLALGQAATSSTHASSGAVLVSNNNDAGPGSFRNAIDQANADPGVTHIQFTGRVLVIALQQSVVFTGAQALRLDGNGATIDGSGVALGAAFLATGGGDLEISRLTVRDAPAEGIAVEVPSSATGTSHVSLFRVETLNNLGLEVDERGAGDVRVDVFGAETVRNGRFDPADLDDGFDIDEYNDGSVIGVVAFTNASDNYEEGLDFNENNAGDLRVDLMHVVVSGNREEGVDFEEDDDFAGGGDAG